MSKTIIISNRLPVRIESKGGELVYKKSEGGLATGLGSIFKGENNLWIGWPGMAFEEESQMKTARKKLQLQDMAPVFLTSSEVKDYYLGFSNQTLWPAFHYFVQYIQFNEDHWEAYQRVNQKFAKAVAEHLEPGDLIWVHDYQLLLLPGMLREIQPELSIGFFQHIPFPSYEVFRMIPWRKKLLEGMLGADYIAFHTYDDMRHFMSSVHRLVGLSYEKNEVQYKERLVVIDSLPMGIDYDKYASSAASQEAKAREDRYRETLSDRLILSVDRLDYSKGINMRLRAFESFLEKYPAYIEGVSLFLVVVPSRDKVPSYQSLKEEIDELVGKINGRFSRVSWQPVRYFYRSFPLEALSAFYRMCEVAMITPMRDGMNLVCKEFIASKTDKKGVLILSEMAGAAKELSDAVLVNPNDQKQLVESIRMALEMPEEEQIRRLTIMQETVKKYNIFNWVRLFVNNLEKVKEKQREMDTSVLDAALTSTIVKDYNHAKRRLILLDYDGTLVPHRDNPEECAPSDSLLNTLSKLKKDDRNTIVVISGRKPKDLDRWLGELNIQLVAEHGAWLKELGSEWRLNPELSSNEWKRDVKDIINFYVERTPGSYLEEKNHALVWHYRKVEKGLGNLRSSELFSHVKYMKEKDLDIMEGRHIVEVKPSATNKGKIAKEFYTKYKPSFVLALGDDRTDEYMFEALLNTDAYTISVGHSNSHAQYSTKDHENVHQLLTALVNGN